MTKKPILIGSFVILVVIASLFFLNPGMTDTGRPETADDSAGSAPESPDNPAASEAPTATPTPDATPTPVPTGTEPSATPTVTPTPTPQSSSTPAPTAAPSSTPTPVTVNPNIKWGSYLVDGPSEMASFENMVGAEMDILAIFTGWGSSHPFPDWVSSVKNQGKTLLIYWEQHGTTLDRIISGQDDEYIRSYAAGAKAYGGPIIMAPLHEMNGNWDPWNGPVGNNSPEKVIAAWRHMHDLFQETGTPNVKWGWAPNTLSVPNTPENAIGKYYPGSSYVDYVGVDGFNWGSPWEDFDDVFGNALSQISGYGKPIYIFSTSSAEGPMKDDWIREFGAEVSRRGLAGWIWFNEDKERNWLVNSDADSLAAFREIVK